MSEGNHRGLGDTIKSIADKTGITNIVEAITDDCGCKKRQEWLNNKFPYKTLNDGEEKTTKQGGKGYIE